MPDSLSCLEYLPDYPHEAELQKAVLEVLQRHPEVHRTTSGICYLACVKSLGLKEMWRKPTRVDISVAEIDRLENELSEVFKTFANRSGRCYVINKVLPDGDFKIRTFWSVFEEQTLKKESALIVAKTAFRLIMWLITRKK